MSGSMGPAPSGVKVRMYRQGLGDCFLLAFPDGKGDAFYMLIDCGVLKGTEQAGRKMRAVAQDIIQATNNHIHLLVATHEHWDHVSGFLQAEDLFRQMQIDSVWLAWTEDPSDDLAVTLGTKRADQVRALQATVQRMAGTANGQIDRAAGPAAVAPEEPGDAGQEAADELQSRIAARTEFIDRVQGLLDFFGDAWNYPHSRDGAPAAGMGADSPGAPGAPGNTTAAALASIQKDARGMPRQVRYCRPGEGPLDLLPDGTARVYVLGPPRDLTLLHKSDPTRTGKEVYELTRPLTQDTAFLVAAEHGQSDTKDLALDALEALNRSFPFDRAYQIRTDAARSDACAFQGFFEAHYGFGESETAAPWRRIDDDWLDAAGPLALQLDSDTNNTSLVLAIEVGEKGKGRVLLFAADAQVGNWLSWKLYTWPARPAADETPQTCDDLLARTVLYKVGHHGSHNATLRAEGLEKMTDPDLVAMIPVDHAMAEKKRWAMPLSGLLEALKQRTKGRVLRIDDGADAAAAPAWAGPQPHPAWVAQSIVGGAAPDDPPGSQENDQAGYIEVVIEASPQPPAATKSAGPS